MKRFPLRTLLLMILALAAFARLWWVSHPHASPPGPLRVEVLAKPDGG
jgi:hypothetical protein